MSRLFKFTALSCAVVVMCALGVFSQTLAVESSQISVPLHRSEVVNLPRSTSKFTIDNPSIADLARASGNKLSIQGLRLGNASIKVTDRRGRVLKYINLSVIPDLPSLRQSLKALLPYENIGVELVGNNIALTGIVTDAEAASRAFTIANESVRSQNYDRDVVNLLQVASGQQVMLRVRVGEIERSALKKIGVSLQGLRTTSDWMIPFATGNEIGTSIATLGVDDDSFASGGIIYDTAKVDLSASLDLLERDGLFKVLAEPNLVAVSGRSAEFLAGGEFPVPVAQGDERTTVQFKKFGVSVAFTPQVLSQNRIRLQVRPEVSELSTEGSVTTESFSIPSISTRRASTTVELAPGESFMIAGLIKDELTTNIDEVPGLSDIPLLSSVLRHSSVQRTETELVIAVTPYIVNPTTSGEVRLPTDHFRPATVLETLFFGALGSRVSNRGNSGSLEGPFGFMMD